VGWFLHGELITSDFVVLVDTTIFAHFQRITVGRNYTLTFVLEGGVLPAGVPNPQTHAYGTVVPLPVPTRAGFVFAGWMLNNAMVTSPFTIRGNTTLTAVWLAEAPPTPTPAPTIPPGQLVVVFDPSPGNFTGGESGVRTGVYGFVVQSMQTPTRAGYTFVGWHHGGTRITLPLTVRRDMTIGALWTPVQGAYVPGRPNPQTSPIAVSFTIFGAVILVGITAFGITKLTRKQKAAAGQYRSDMTRYNREERILDMFKGGGPKKK